MDFIFNDGGRKESGYKGFTGDCVVRAIAIALKLPYKDIYDELFEYMRIDNSKKRKHKEKTVSPRKGILTPTIRRYLKDKGWSWNPIMKIGSGCTMHVTPDELPKGTLILRLSRHMCAVVDKKIHDTYNPSRDGMRCVYGYWSCE